MRAIRHDEMPVDVEGWLASPRVRRMTTSERGMFWQLLCEAWADAGCSLPAHREELRFLAGATETEWEAGSEKVLAMFDVRDGRLTNAKQLEVLEAQNRRLSAARANKERVAKYRAGKPDQDEEKSECSTGNSAASPETPIKPAAAEMSPFDLFWKLYPLKKGRGVAEKAFEKAIKKATIAQILAAVAEQMGWEEWTKDGGQFIPHPATWLNQGRWSDEKAGPPPAPEPAWYDNGRPDPPDPFKNVREDVLGVGVPKATP